MRLHSLMCLRTYVHGDGQTGTEMNHLNSVGCVAVHGLPRIAVHCKTTHHLVGRLPHADRHVYVDLVRTVLLHMCTQVS
jgi:hypothetical protein